jgi:hypothetical protein
MPRDDEYMMTAEEVRLRNLKRRRIIVGVSVAVLLVLLALLGGRPAMSAIKGWQARRHAGRAFSYIEKQNWNDARKEALAAYQLRPTEPQSVRAVARFLSRTRQPNALDFWQQLGKITSLTREDRQDEAAIAMMAGETTRAESAVKALLELKKTDPTGWLLAAQLSIQKGAADDAMAALNKIFDNSTATPRQQLQAALLEVSLGSGSTQPDDHEKDAWARIEKISQGTDPVALDALVLLARRELSGQKSQVTGQTTEKEQENGANPGANNAEYVSALAQRLTSHPLSKAPQKLLALDLQAQVDPARRNQLIEQAIKQWKDGGADDLLALATWLNSKNEFQKTVDTIPLKKALLTRELFFQHLDALGALGRWSEISDLLEHERYPLDPVMQKMYLARCNAQLGEKVKAENNWKRAVEAAGGDAGKLITLGEYAEKNGILDVAQTAFETASMDMPNLRVAQQGRLRIAQRSGNITRIHGVLEDMLRLWPNDPAVQNDEAYARLLVLGKDNRNDKAKENSPQTRDQVAAIEKVAEKLVEQHPRSLPHRTLLALARLKQNRAADALTVYDNVKVAPGALTAPALAVHAAVLAANGRTDDAKTEASQVKPEQLLPEERALIQNL